MSGQCGLLTDKVFCTRESPSTNRVGFDGDGFMQCGQLGRNSAFFVEVQQRCDLQRLQGSPVPRVKLRPGQQSRQPGFGFRPAVGGEMDLGKIDLNSVGMPFQPSLIDDKCLRNLEQFLVVENPKRFISFLIVGIGAK